MANTIQTNDRASSLESLIIYVLIAGMLIGAVFLLTSKTITFNTAEPTTKSLSSENE